MLIIMPNKQGLVTPNSLKLKYTERLFVRIHLDISSKYKSRNVDECKVFIFTEIQPL